MNTFVPFSIGTVRGSYTCGRGNDPAGGVQFLVKGENGWVPFIESRFEETKCRKRAESYSREILNKKIKQTYENQSN